ncbi:MAG: kelch repeat-containing protein [Myxococcota bacterium]
MELAGLLAVVASVATGSVLAGCGGQSGLITVEIKSAPGSDLLERVDSVRATLTEPLVVIEAERDSDGRLAIELEVDAEGQSGFLELEGRDASGQRIAFGRSGPLPIAAIDATISIYMGAPGTLSEAPVQLVPARTEMGTSALSFGVFLGGGRTATETAVSDVGIYSVYTHAIEPGLDLGMVADTAAPRRAPTAMTALGGLDDVYVFGGFDDRGQPRGEAWRYLSTVPPSGVYSELVSDTEIVRADARAVLHGQELFVITGEPPLVLDGLLGVVRELDDPSQLSGAAATTVADGRFVSLFTGAGNPGGAALLVNGVAEAATGAQQLERTGHATVVLPDGDLLTVAGRIDDTPVRSAVRFDPATRQFEVLDDMLLLGRIDAAVAVTAEYLIVAGGTDEDGVILGDAEVFDARTLERIGDPIAMVQPRTAASVGTLSNGQMLIAGGVDADEQPIATIELFTPQPR